MKKLLIILLTPPLLLGGLALGLLATGTVDSTSLRMGLNVVLGLPGPATDEETARRNYHLPEGFTLSLYSDSLPRARFLRFTPRGDLLVSRPHAGDIVLLRDADGDGDAETRHTVITGLNRPQGMDFLGEWLYIAEREQVGRVRFDADRGQTAGEYQPLITGLTGNGNHWSKTLRFGPDGLLYLAQGSTCNVCVEEDKRRATMMRFNPDGSGGKIIATGLRNSVGFDWSPFDGGLYATDNGRDFLGDDFPPCELNRIEQGEFYGWPYFNGDNIPDPDMGADPLAGERSPSPPVHGFRAHNAPLGISFVDSHDWPGDYQRVALVALHGSWNRSTPDGYKVVSLHFGDGKIEERDFLSGFNRGGEIRGRPVDVVQGPDGAIYISDDYAGAVYRVTTAQTTAASVPVVPPPQRQLRLDETAPAWLQEADLVAMAARAAALYREHNCASCHQQGENPVPLDDLDQRLGYRAIIDTLTAPRAPMPLFPLTTEQQRELAVYLLHGASP